MRVRVPLAPPHMWIWRSWQRAWFPPMSHRIVPGNPLQIIAVSSGEETGL